MRSSRPYVQIDPDVLERARQIDLFSYLKAYEPNNLVKVKGTTNVYCIAEHDSLKISNGKWYWWSRGFGGYSALDSLCYKYRNSYLLNLLNQASGTIKSLSAKMSVVNTEPSESYYKIKGIECVAHV